MGFPTVHIESRGEKQFISLPDNFKVEGDKFYLKKLGDLIYLIPYNNPWKSIWESLDLFSDDYLDTRSQNPSEKREEL